MTKISAKISIPDYRIIRKIGEGGMSVVYLAYQESLKREVALKVMRPIITDEENVLRRFEREAETIAKLYHPNIVSIYEVGNIDEEILYYAMPYLQHGDLSEFVYNSDDDLKVMLSGICDGLAYAHSQGVVHRDIKPENILFDQFGQVQIADFGIALSTGRKRFTRENRIVGSVHYMSPEQAQSKQVDARSDIYGLGAILYEILTGEPVFNEEDDLSLMMAHVDKKVPLLPSHLAHWQPVINKCLAKSPSQRYQTVDALKKAVLATDSHLVKDSKAWLISAFAVVILIPLLVLGWYQWNQSQTTSGNPEQTNNPAAQLTVKKPSLLTEPNDNAAELLQDNIDEPKPDSNQVPLIDNQLNQAEVQAVVQEQKFPTVENQLGVAESEKLITKAQQNIARKQLTTPKDNNALDQILLLLKNIPDHPQGLVLLSEVMAGYYELMYQAVQKNDLQQASQFAASVAEVRHRTILTHEFLLTYLENDTELERSLLLGAIAEKVNLAKSRGNHQQADRLIALVDKVMPGHQIIAELNTEVKGIPKSGHVLKDKLGLRSVVVSPEANNTKGYIKYALAVNETEVSWQLFDQFVEATDHEISRCKTAVGSNMIFSQRNYSKPGFSTSGDVPVVCVTWQDANMFVAWYNKKSGEQYRLPSILEWRHLIKLSGVKNPSCKSENLAGREFPEPSEDMQVWPCDDGYPYVAPHGAFNKNPLGLLGFHGNAAEWLAGCQELGKFKSIFNPDDQCESNPSAGFSWLSDANASGQVAQIKFNQAWSHIGFRMVRKIK